MARGGVEIDPTRGPGNVAGTFDACNNSATRIRPIATEREIVMKMCGPALSQVRPPAREPIRDVLSEQIIKP